MEYSMLELPFFLYPYFYLKSLWELLFISSNIILSSMLAGSVFKCIGSIANMECADKKLNL